MHTTGKISAAMRQREVGAITPGERAKLATVLCAMSLSGEYAPPLFIFGGVGIKYELTRNGPVNAVLHQIKAGSTRIFSLSGFSSSPSILNA